MKKLQFSTAVLLSLVFFSSCTTEKIENTVVIGGGLMGSATAWHLVNANIDVLVIEQQDSIYTYGSSLGTARIARSSNRSNNMWSYLHNRTVAEAEKLISFLNEGQEAVKYSMDDIYNTTPANYVGLSRIFDQLVGSFKTQKVDGKLATTPQEGEDLFNIQIPEGVLYHREYNPHTGTINPKQLISHLHTGIRKKHGRVLYSHRVESLVEKDGLFEITVTDLKTEEIKTIKSRKVVSAAGPYTGSLLKDVAPYFQVLITPQRVFISFFKVESEVWNNYSKDQKKQVFDGYPVINSSAGTRKGSFFSMIEYIDTDGIPVIKIGGHHQRSDITDLDSVWKQDVSEEEIAWSRRNTLNYFDMLNVPLDSTSLNYIDGYSCVYSLTKTEVPYVTSIKDSNGNENKNLVVVGGMSGGGAKGTMAYGLIAAHLLLNHSESDQQYQEARKALGYDRLIRDLKSD